MAGRMSGPFSRERVEEILGGAFFASPLIVAIQTQEPGVPDKVRICRHLSKEGKGAQSVNSHIEKEEFPTRFDTALRVADIVSFNLYASGPHARTIIPMLVAGEGRRPPHTVSHRRSRGSPGSH